MFDTPIVFIIFNRPATTEKVFAKIREVKPAQLLVIADGGRPDSLDDTEKCAAARRIIEGVDWDCQVIKNYSSTNLGCAKRIETGLNWVFQLVEEAIILEDDCLPDASFFPFCQQLLERYRHDGRVMQIGGHNRLFQWRLSRQSYHFSYLYGSPHGWATWRRAWNQYNLEDRAWDDPRNLLYLEQVIPDREDLQKFLRLCDRIFNDPDLEDEWGYKWTFVKLTGRGLSVIPATNLVTNIGCGAGGTHMKHRTLLNGSSIPKEPIGFPLVHPGTIEPDLEFETEHGCWSIGEPSAIALLPLIQKLLSGGQNINALVLLDKALSEQPDSILLNRWKAEALIALKQPRRAMAVIEHLLNHSPQSGGAISPGEVLGSFSSGFSHPSP
ncbi:MAG: hypothetical protein N5P05_003787 [Chroococcopsis gigantea SAG 12.99]|jgi:hypothetical protein|nr:tetratricopeptide repeat protein [Chlorogloea purpurea SAG 13.99]MDV3002181.1 hypothetical protein [Chroococcopsis gigantea SAG 12.99]